MQEGDNADHLLFRCFALLCNFIGTADKGERLQVVLEHEVCACVCVRAQFCVCRSGLVLEEHIRLQLLTSPVTNNSQLLSDKSACVNTMCQLSIYYPTVKKKQNSECEKYLRVL